MDYSAVSIILMFAACETRQCVNIPIVNNKTLEMAESFVVTLERTPELTNRIILNPVDGDVNILDDDDCKYDSMKFRQFRY